MTHRAESILVAVATAVGNLTTTGTRVVRGRAYAADDMPSLGVSMGAENPGAYNVAFQDEQLDVVITNYVKDTEGNTDTVHNTIAVEVYAAIMSNRQLGLAYVHDTRWRGRSAPMRDTAEQAVSTQELNFTVHYRHSITSTGA